MMALRTSALRDRAPAMLGAFLRDEQGAATIELVVWIPFVFALFFLVVDASVFYWQYATLWDTARDAARQISIGTMAPSSADVTTFAQSRMGTMATGFVSDSGSINPGVEVRATFGSMTLLQSLTVFLSGNTVIVARVQMRSEPL
jgi:Flp pilus assembly protein TadG